MSHLPTSGQLLADPELAILHVLASTLAVAQQALFAAHPRLEDEHFSYERPLHLTAAGSIANSILTQAYVLELSIRGYQQELLRARDRKESDDLPF